MQLGTPVGRHPRGWPRRGRTGRAVLRIRKPRTIKEVFDSEVVEPALIGLVTLYHPVTARVGVSSCMLVRRTITTADVPTLRASTKVQPPPTDLIAVDTAVAAGDAFSVDERRDRSQRRPRPNDKNRRNTFTMSRKIEAASSGAVLMSFTRRSRWKS